MWIPNTWTDAENKKSFLFVNDKSLISVLKSFPKENSAKLHDE